MNTKKYKNHLSNKLNICKKASVKSIILVMLFILVFNVIFPSAVVFADNTRAITVTVKWNDASCTSLRPDNVTLRLKNKNTSAVIVSDDNSWTKNGNEWTYVFMVPNNTNQYEVWEDDVTYYTITATDSNNSADINHMPIVNNSATITNTNNKVKITVTKEWVNDNLSNAERPNIDIHLNKTTTTLLPGTNLCAQMKTIANNGSNTSFDNKNSEVQKIIKATLDQYNAKRSSLNSSNEIQNTGENTKVYMWYDSTTKTLLYYSDADNIYLNTNSTYAFSYFRNLNDISGLSGFNASYVQDMDHMFYDCRSLTSLNGIENWNVANVKDMSWMFSGYYTKSEGKTNLMQINSLEPLRNWNVSNVQSLQSLFEYSQHTDSFTSIEPLKDWNVRCVTNMYHVFNRTMAEDGYYVEGWDVRSVSSGNFAMMFEFCPSNKTYHNLVPFTIRSGNWDDGTYRNSGSPTVYSTHMQYSPVDGNDITTSSCTKNGDTWTYTFIVNADRSIYKAYEDTTNLPSNYVSSAGSLADAIYVENNQATITNTNTKRYITVTKNWNDDGNTSLRPANITLHLTKNGTDVQVSNNTDWTINGNTWTYTFEVSDNDNYSVWEDAVYGYTTNAPQNSPIAISNDSATIINNIQKYDVTLIKKVTGNLASLEKSFDFTITLYDRNNTALSGNITIERNGTQQQILNGSTISLKHNEQVIVKDVVIGYKYNITETDTDYTEHYKIEKTDDSTELVALNVGRVISNRELTQNETATFINDKESVPATMAGTYSNPFVITIILSTILIIAVKNRKYLEEFVYKNI